MTETIFYKFINIWYYITLYIYTIKKKKKKKIKKKKNNKKKKY